MFHAILKKTNTLVNSLEIDDTPDHIRREEIFYSDTMDRKISNLINNKLMNILRCPRCGDYLIKKNGPHGFFYGCNNYPICKYILKSRGALNEENIPN